MKSVLVFSLGQLFEKFLITYIYHCFEIKFFLTLVQNSFEDNG